MRCSIPIGKRGPVKADLLLCEEVQSWYPGTAVNVSFCEGMQCEVSTLYTVLLFHNLPINIHPWVWGNRGARKLVHGALQLGSTRYWNYLEGYWPCAGGLSAAVNAIGTQLRDPMGGLNK